MRYSCSNIKGLAISAFFLFVLCLCLFSTFIEAFEPVCYFLCRCMRMQIFLVPRDVQILLRKQKEKYTIQVCILYNITNRIGRTEEKKSMHKNEERKWREAMEKQR